MEDFPVSSPPLVDDALIKILVRFDKLNTEDFINHLKTKEEEEFIETFERLPLSLHHYLFSGIINNAGQYRAAEDPGNGIVFFGPSQRFPGYSTEKIEDGVKKSVSCLTINPDDPVYNAVKFYQQFVMVHPFYDANGRIGRFMLETYLNFHNIVMQWRDLHSNNKWLNRINECHKRFQSGNYEFYLNILVTHWKLCTKKISD
ncbi:Fic family protein [Desulfogranum japonicum]|uniref:Fic family protein n=1 Tax=Desulfogranum japonicum TaxID=231447 RepID=UPI00054EB0B5|nr:Fic family protein [Desulfogranum japonicum]